MKLQLKLKISRKNSVIAAAEQTMWPVGMEKLRRRWNFD